MLISKKMSKLPATLAYKFDENSKHGHTFFVQQHVVRKQESFAENNSILLVMNVAPYCDEKSLRRIFGDCGRIKEIRTQKKPGKIEEKKVGTEIFPSPPMNGFHVAYIFFEKHTAIEKVLNKAKTQTEPIVLSTAQHEIPIGMKKWCLDYLKSFPNPKKMQSEIDAYMQEYDKKVEEEERKEQENEGVPDEDGWVKVARRGRNAGASRVEAKELQIKAKERKKRKQQELLNVYSYQVRESKREKIAELRQKFEEDKKKIETMRKARRFRPF